MLKKTFKIILTITILVVIGLGIYWFFDKQQGGGGLTKNGNELSFRDFFPFGSGKPTDTTLPPTPNNTDSTNNPDQTPPVPPPRLWQISIEPQSGAVAFFASSTPMVRFADRATGHIFESQLNLTGIKRITNTTIPKVYEALWRTDGSTVNMRYLSDNSETTRAIIGRISTSTITTDTNSDTIEELRTTFLPDNITSLSINPVTGALLYVIKDISGSQIYIANADNSNSRVLYESSIKDINASWINNTTIAVQDKPSAVSAGQLYFIKTGSKQTERVLGGILGLSTLTNSSSTLTAYSASNKTSIVSGIYDHKKGDTKTFSFTVIPEKCVWSAKTVFIYCASPKNIPSGRYPDDWYQGKVSFNDKIWRLDTTTGTTELLIDPYAEAQVELDAIKISLDPTEEFLIFTNKKDYQLWGLKIQKNS